MEAKAVVKKIINENYAEIEVMRKSACGDSCASCSGCDKPTHTAKAVAKNTKKAQVGDVVNVRGSTGFVLKGASFVYVLPLFLFLIGYFASQSFGLSEGINSLIGVLFFSIGIYISGVYSKKISKKNESNLEIY